MSVATPPSPHLQHTQDAVWRTLFDFFFCQLDVGPFDTVFGLLRVSELVSTHDPRVLTVTTHRHSIGYTTTLKENTAWSNIRIRFDRLDYGLRYIVRRVLNFKKMYPHHPYFTNAVVRYYSENPLSPYVQ